MPFIRSAEILGQFTGLCAVENFRQCHDMKIAGISVIRKRDGHQKALLYLLFTDLGKCGDTAGIAEFNQFRHRSFVDSCLLRDIDGIRCFYQFLKALSHTVFKLLYIRSGICRVAAYNFKAVFCRSFFYLLYGGITPACNRILIGNT